MASSRRHHTLPHPDAVLAISITLAFQDKILATEWDKWLKRRQAAADEGGE